MTWRETNRIIAGQAGGRGCDTGFEKVHLDVTKWPKFLKAVSPLLCLQLLTGCGARRPIGRPWALQKRS